MGTQSNAYVDARPVIGLCSKTDENSEYTIVSTFYANCILQAGGIPVVLPYHESADILASCLALRMDGILFTGGVDISENSFCGHAYDPTTHHALGDQNPIRDTFEAALIDSAWTEDLPCLGICRGIQIMNVARGGTLVRDVTEQPQACEGVEILTHARWDVQYPYNDAPTHEIDIDPESKLAHILGTTHTRVNSLHHLAIATPAPGGRIVARATDGTPEALEFPEKSFFLGVQWHPEIMGTQPALFEAFVEACKTRRQERMRAISDQLG